MNASSVPTIRLPAPVSAWMASHSPVERGIAAGLALAAAIALALGRLLAADGSRRRSASPRGARATPPHSRMPARSHAKWRALHPVPRNSRRPTHARLLDRVLAQQNLREAVTSLDWRDGRARIVLAAVGYDALIVALEALQRDARLRVVEATITARVEPGIVRAELTLGR